MSEYQYYEFQALDRALTDDEQADISSLSSRVDLTRRRASFVYNYGDFRGNPDQVLAQYFDAMLYMANWGTTQLMFRFPKALVDLDQITPYCLEDAVSYSIAGDYVVLKIYWYAEEGRGWIDGEGWLDLLIPLRDDILRQDYRALYLAWLMAISSVYLEDVDEPVYEPPVPPGLQQLSKPLRTFIELFEIDDILLQAVSQSSREQSRTNDEQLREAISRLSRTECNDFLARLLHGESNLAIVLKRRLRELLGEEESVSERAQESRRTAEELLELVDNEREEWQHKQTQAEEARRKREMEALAREAPQLWTTVYALIAKKQVKAYDEAVNILAKLKNLADYQDEQAAFQEKITRIHKEHQRLPGLRSRLSHAGLSPK